VHSYQVEITDADADMKWARIKNDFTNHCQKVKQLPDFCSMSYSIGLTFYIECQLVFSSECSIRVYLSAMHCYCTNFRVVYISRDLNQVVEL